MAARRGIAKKYAKEYAGAGKTGEGRTFDGVVALALHCWLMLAVRQPELAKRALRG